MYYISYACIHNHYGFKGPFTWKEISALFSSSPLIIQYRYILYLCIMVVIVHNILLECTIFWFFWKENTIVHVWNWLWLDVYWNWLSDKIGDFFTNVDVSYYCLQNFAWTHHIIINLLHVLSCVDFIYLPLLCKTFKHSLSSVSVWPRGLRRQLGDQGVAGSIPTGDKYFRFKFFAFFSFLTARRSQYKLNQAWHSSRVIRTQRYI